MFTVFAVVTKVSIVSLLLLLARGFIWLLNMLFVSPLFDPLKRLPGPDGSALQSHLREVLDPKLSSNTHNEWKKRYGNTFRFHGFGKHDYRLMSFDFRAVSYVLNSAIYEKPWQTRVLLARLIGRGIFSMEGSEHKAQRKLIGPAFSTQSVKAMTPVFFQKAEELCSRWEDLVSEASSCTEPRVLEPTRAPKTAPRTLNGATIDIAHWISRASFDAIGLAGFDYHFNALADESENVYLAYRRMFNVADKGLNVRGLLELYFPVIRRLWPNEDTNITNESLRVIDIAGKTLVASKKAAILADKSNIKDIRDKDILSLLIKSNLSSDPSKRMSDAELLDQCSTLLLAGSDSVSLAISWCLHFLSKGPRIQTRLRDEILSLPIASTYRATLDSRGKSSGATLDSNANSRTSLPPSNSIEPDISRPLQEYWDALENLPFLDAIVRETLRICPPVHSTIRMASADDRIPTSQPVPHRDGTTGHKGEFIDIRKGTYIHIPIEGLNLSEEIWGSDASEFNPDRWTSLPPNARSPLHPGLGNTMTFGFGPHSCLGYKFSITEIKVFLATILSQFVFSPVEGVEISKFSAILTRPYIVDKWELGTTLPLVVERYTNQSLDFADS